MTLFIYFYLGNREMRTERSTCTIEGWGNGKGRKRDAVSLRIHQRSLNLRFPEVGFPRTKKSLNLGSESLLLTFDHRILLLKYFITQVLRAVYTHCEATSKMENLSCYLQSVTKYLPLDR